MAGSVRDNSLSELSILFTIGGNTYKESEFSEFRLTNVLNNAPSGEFVILDQGSNSITGDESGQTGELIFTNTSDNNEEKMSRLQITIDDVIDVSPSNGPNKSYAFTWTAGNADMLEYKNAAHTGTSTTVMQAILKAASVHDDIFPYPEQAKKLSDNMTWRYISEDMWGMLTQTVEHSHLNDDYLYWCWDDVNNSYNISSFGISDSVDDRYILMHSEDSVANTEAARTVYDNPDFTVWRFDTARKENAVGRVRAKLKPNVSFSVDDGTKKVGGRFANECFDSTIESMEPKPTTREDGTSSSRSAAIKSKSGFKDGASYAPLQVKRHYKNNVHNLYQFAKTYRDYKISTYAKKASVALMNTMGPPLGSKVTLFVPGDDYKISGEVLDTKYSDKYIVAAKVIEYNTVQLDHMGRSTPASSNIVTKVILISDNFNGDGTEHIADIIKKVS
jgi:hypothetical protein